jgi:hypothetical protein
VPSLFLTGSGKGFSDANFSQYWTKLMTTATDIEPLPAVKFRTIFVENYTLKHGGAPEDLWEGAAAIMGNTPRTWTRVYNPSRRKRLASEVVAEYSSFIAKHTTMEESDNEELV